jgi:PAS domain S-box-containing protein
MAEDRSTAVSHSTAISADPLIQRNRMTDSTPNGLSDSDIPTALLRSMNQAFCIIEKVPSDPGGPSDYRYIVVNAAFERHTALRDVVGKTIRDLVHDLEQRIIDIYDDVCLSGAHRQFTDYVSALDMWVEAEALPTQTPGRIAVLFSNVSERIRAEQALKKSEERQALLLKLADGLRSLTDSPSIQREVTRTLGEYLQADRTFYAEIDDAQRVGIIERDYIRGSASSVVGRYPFESIAPLLEAVRQGESFVVDDVQSDPRLVNDHPMYESLSVRSYVTVPLIKAGTVVATLTISNTRPRRWGRDEVVLLRAVAERTWDAIERARASEAQRESDERFHQFAETSQDALWIRNADTLAFEYVSPAFEALYGIARGHVLERNNAVAWLELLHPDDVEGASAALGQLRQGIPLSHEFRIIRPADGEILWIRNTDFPMRDSAGRVTRIAGIAHDITETKKASEYLQVLNSELQHRTRNLIGVVQTLCHKTLAESDSLEEFRRDFTSRLAAIARVQGLLSRLSEDERVSFSELLKAELSAHAADDERVSLQGPQDVCLRSSAVQVFALALHELATNSVKYGALSQPGGRLKLRWDTDEDLKEVGRVLHVEWIEEGVPIVPPGPPSLGTGFGRELIEHALPYQLKAKTRYELRADGVRCTITAPIASRMPRSGETHERKH